MRFFVNIARKFLNEPKKVLGRWQLDDCNKKINKKIDYSNEDHCGPCGKNNMFNYIVDVPKRKPA